MQFFPIFILLVLSLCSPALAEHGKTQVQVLLQVGSIRGKHIIYIAKDAIRTEGVNSGRVTIAKGPKWTVQTYDSNTNQYAETPYAKHKGNEMKPLFLYYGVDLAAFDWRPVGQEKIAGIEALHLMPFPGPSATPDQIKLAKRCGGLWVAKATQYPKQVGRLVSILYAMPTNDRVPLKFVFDADDQKKQNGLNTISNQTKLLSDTLFSVPAGAKRAATENLTLPQPDGLLY
jgi:hypothetical protein